MFLSSVLWWSSSVCLSPASASSSHGQAASHAIQVRNHRAACSCLTVKEGPQLRERHTQHLGAKERAKRAQGKGLRGHAAAPGAAAEAPAASQAQGRWVTRQDVAAVILRLLRVGVDRVVQVHLNCTGGEGAGGVPPRSAGHWTAQDARPAPAQPRWRTIHHHHRLVGQPRRHAHRWGGAHHLCAYRAVESCPAAARGYGGRSWQCRRQLAGAKGAAARLPGIPGLLCKLAQRCFAGRLPCRRARKRRRAQRGPVPNAQGAGAAQEVAATADPPEDG